MAALFKWVIERLSEASTWQGITVVVSAAGVRIEPELALQIATTGASVFGLINVIKKG
jgi:hypothetical protein